MYRQSIISDPLEMMTEEKVGRTKEGCKVSAFSASLFAHVLSMCPYAPDKSARELMICPKHPTN